MEYKIGQRVKHVDAEFYIESIVGDAAIIGDRGITHTVRLDGLSPLYKPGDQVRVTATEGDLADIALDGVVTEGSIIVVEGYIEGGWIKFDGWSIDTKYVEWYSGPKVATKQSSGSRDFVAGDDGYFYFGGMSPEEYIKWLKDDTILVAEVHQDKEWNRAALAEVLKIKETPQQLWKCPYYDNHTHRPCNETGSKHDIRQHSKTAHGEALPPTNSPVWEHWRVS